VSGRGRPLRVGDRVPDFTLRSQTGEQVRLADRIGTRTLVIYFYPKDNTPGCTAEACAFSDGYEQFTAAGADVIGISSDSVESHARFAIRHGLAFTLLSDPDGTVRARYGVPRTLGLLPGRTTYVIDRDGVVRLVFSSLTKVDQHVSGALALVRTLQEASGAPPADGPPPW